MLIDAAVSLLGLAIPPVFDFIKKKFIKAENDTPERTIGTLATTKPEVLADYVRAVADYLKAQADHFNRDVIGQCSLWVVNLRAAIRPIGVILAFIVLGGMVAAIFTGNYDRLIAIPNGEATLTGVRLTCEALVTSWFGSRFTITGAK